MIREIHTVKASFDGLDDAASSFVSVRTTPAIISVSPAIPPLACIIQRDASKLRMAGYRVDEKNLG